MHCRIRLISLFALSCFAFAAGAEAQYENHVKTPEKKLYTIFRRNISDNIRVSSIKTDSINRIWFSSNYGITALAANTSLNPNNSETFFDVAKFFPLSTSKGLLDNKISAIAFGAVDSQEHFFASFTGFLKVQYGRILSTSGLALEGELEPKELDAADQIFDLAASGKSLWMATSNGLRLWNLAANLPEENVAIRKKDEVILKVATNSNELAAFVVQQNGADDKLFIALSDPKQKSTFEFDLDLAPIGKLSILDLKFDKNLNLWVLAADMAGNGNMNNVFVRMYSAANFSSPGPVIGTLPDDLGPNEDSFSGFTDKVFGLAIDNSNSNDDSAGYVWLATDNGAWYAAISADDNTLGEWTQYVDAETNQQALGSDEVQSVHVDKAGNIWFATDEGVEGAIIRILSLNDSKFIGFDSRAVLTVIEALKKDDGEESQITVSVDSGTKTDLILTEKGDTGVFVGSFKFTEGDAANAIKVSSSAEATTIKFTYNFDELDKNKILTAEASWANEVEFEDDFLIGGPCFLEAFKF